MKSLQTVEMSSTLTKGNGSVPARHLLSDMPRRSGLSEPPRSCSTVTPPPPRRRRRTAQLRTHLTLSYGGGFGKNAQVGMP
jgi:hypothetical protein